MFVSTKILKRLMKQANKTGGLYLAQTEERIYIAGSYWELDVAYEVLPKQIMAQIIELAGKLPGEGGRMKNYKDECEMVEGTFLVSEEGFADIAEVTPLILVSKGGIQQRLLQTEKDIKIINNVFIDMIDNEELDPMETKAEGPYYRTSGKSNSILWKNNCSRFRVYVREDEDHERLIEELNMLDLSEEVV